MVLTNSVSLTATISTIIVDAVDNVSFLFDKTTTKQTWLFFLHQTRKKAREINEMLYIPWWPLNSVLEENAVVLKLLSSFLFPSENTPVMCGTARWTVTISLCHPNVSDSVKWGEDEDERWRPTSEVEEFMVRYSSSYIITSWIERNYDTIQIDLDLELELELNNSSIIPKIIDIINKYYDRTRMNRHIPYNAYLRFI